ncbi:hypothetical protein, partial [Thiohalocapsa halophila]
HSAARGSGILAATSSSAAAGIRRGETPLPQRQHRPWERHPCRDSMDEQTTPIPRTHGGRRLGHVIVPSRFAKLQ